MTIWMGHLAKTVNQAQIMQAFEDFGQVKSVDVSLIEGHQFHHVTWEMPPIDPCMGDGNSPYFFSFLRGGVGQAVSL